MSSFRRFVFLVTNGNKSGNYLLRRFDIGRLFLSKRKRDRLAGPPALEEGHLPAPEITFRIPPVYLGFRAMNFLLMGGSHGSRDEKVVSVDTTGRALLYDTEKRTIRALQSFAVPKIAPVSLLTNGGKNLYVMDSRFTSSVGRDEVFEALIYDKDDDDEDDWHPCSLPPPPYAPWFRSAPYHLGFHTESYAVVGGGTSLLFSCRRSSLGTHCFDLESGSWSKVGDWSLPFYDRLEHDPDQGLWFGLTTDYGDKDSVIGSADLAVADPHQTARIVWTDDLPVQRPDWTSISSHLVYLGRSRFCHARFFKILIPGVGYDHVLVFTALEVERRSGDEIAVVKHRSVKYNIEYASLKRIL